MASSVRMSSSPAFAAATVTGVVDAVAAVAAAAAAGSVAGGAVAGDGGEVVVDAMVGCGWAEV